MGEISVRGGARIGIVNATRPFAKPVVSPMGLRLTCVLDTYDFLPKDVVSLKPYAGLPLFYSGIRITHARSDYSSKMILWCPGNPEKLIRSIRDTGFLPSAPASSEIRWRGIPLRWSPIVLFILIWNGKFLIQNILPHASRNQSSLFALVPLLFAFGVCWGAKRPSEVQEGILRKGRSAHEIKSCLSLIQTVCARLLAIFTILFFSGAIK
jgi:hypothetical protein